jgi:hypothetical protein
MSLRDTTVSRHLIQIRYAGSGQSLARDPANGYVQVSAVKNGTDQVGNGIDVDSNANVVSIQ